MLGSGTFALQAHDPGSVVKYRNMKVKILPNDAAPPAGLVPLADRELDQLVTQASNDNIPLIDLGLAPPAGRCGRVLEPGAPLGVTPGSSCRPSALDIPRQRWSWSSTATRRPMWRCSKAREGRGCAKIVFSSGGDQLSTRRGSSARLQAIRAAGLGWKDFWVPGKP